MTYGDRCHMSINSVMQLSAVKQNRYEKCDSVKGLGMGDSIPWVFIVNYSVQIACAIGFSVLSVYWRHLACYTRLNYPVLFRDNQFSCV